MPQPAFPHQQKASPWFDRRERAQFFRRIVSADWGGHHLREARILEADFAAASRHFDVKRAGQDRMGVDVRAMVAAGLQQIDPQAVELRLARAIERQFVGERRGAAGR